MILFLLRGALIVLAAAVTSLYLLSNQWGAGVDFGGVVSILTAIIGLALLVIAIDAFNPHKNLSAISGVFLGLIVGLLATYAISFVVDLAGLIVLEEIPRAQRPGFNNLLEGVKVIIGLVCCYLCISLVLQTKDDFRFVIPYVEFAKEVRGNRPTLLDTSVIVDGRILDILETRVVQGRLVIPRFVLNELQQIADASDKIKRARGRRGLDMLQKIQANTTVEVVLEDHDADGVGVDQKLINLASSMRARIMTNDYNLNKIATLRGTEVININDLAKALRPVVLPGEHMHVKLVKTGENPSQGVGYLDDGTMVVVENGRDHLGQSVDLTVTSTLQTSAGRMIFGRFANADDEDDQSDPASETDAATPSPQTTTQSESAGMAAKPTPPHAKPSRRNPRRA